MFGERAWIVILTLTSFLAGIAGGILLAGRLPPPPGPQPFAAYEERFVQAFDLNADERRDLRYILGRYHEDIEDLKARQVSDMEPELVRLGRTCRERIRKYVVPETRRTEFDLLVAGLPAEAPKSRVP